MAALQLGEEIGDSRRNSTGFDMLFRNSAGGEMGRISIRKTSQQAIQPLFRKLMHHGSVESADNCQ